MPDPLPKNAEEARRRLTAADIPRQILEVGRTLQKGGFRAELVGGAIRDCLRGVPQSDWDLATDARPEQVQSLFRRTIPTGVQHGTVTVLVGRGDEREGVEVTTFRGEGSYRDGRRPDVVTFHDDLEQDLARRDFTINAFAWDPFGEVFTDCFGGLADLERHLVRAVGDPGERFQEDGLRTMRAVRFCATLEFRLDPNTQEAIGGALHVFDQVSRERVRVELLKLLGAKRPSCGLIPMQETGLWPRVLGEMPDEMVSTSIAAVDQLPPDPILRLARLLWPRRDEAEAIGAVVEDLKLSRADEKRVLELTRPHLQALGQLTGPGEIRRLVSRVGVVRLDDALDIVEASTQQREVVRAACRGAVFEVRDLAVGAKELIADGLATPGPALGDLLRTLLDWVLEDPERNTPYRLLKRASELGSKGPRDGDAG